jgi:hypothetical protein
MSSPMQVTDGCPRWRACLAALGVQLRMLKAQVLEFDRRIMAWHRCNETSKRLDEIPGIGPALATALVASVADPKAFRSALANTEPSTHGTFSIEPKRYSVLVTPKRKSDANSFRELAVCRNRQMMTVSLWQPGFPKQRHQPLVILIARKPQHKGRCDAADAQLRALSNTIVDRHLCFLCISQGGSGCGPHDAARQE